jgi:polyisoprenoid-binding protein YceI
MSNAMKTLAMFSLMVLCGQVAFAQHQVFTIDPSASEVRMRLNTTREVVNGIFHVESGTITLDSTPSAMSGIVVVAAASGKTGIGSRDKRMNKDILEVDQFASVSFVPKTYTGTIATSGDSTIQVSGLFTLLGKSHTITVPMLLHIEGSKVSAKGQLNIPYVQWGVKNPSFLIWKAEDTVAIDLNLVGQFPTKHHYFEEIK